MTFVVSNTGTRIAAAVATLITSIILAIGVCMMVVKNADTFITVNVLIDRPYEGISMPRASVARVLTEVFIMSNGVKSLFVAFVVHDRGFRNYCIMNIISRAETGRFIISIWLLSILLLLINYGVTILTVLINVLTRVVCTLGSNLATCLTRLSTRTMSWPQRTFSYLTNRFTGMQTSRRYNGSLGTGEIGKMGLDFMTGWVMVSVMVVETKAVIIS